ncbi:MAG TPA: type II toxin-antitoxin system HicB family antitoxin [Candidatus Methylacidiphilales bacterium]|jgi:predicted RNase H-like HicB family nuclease|nr:type II toxin-antitoxin system HicB family antitoxin [Candidatus Methylacidiphilales bacterium]
MKKIPSLTAVIGKEGKWYVATCPELGVASQGRTVNEAYAMVQEAVDLFLETASPEEIKRCLASGAKVRKLDLAHA